MPMYAMRLERAATHLRMRFLRHGFKVIWVHTAWVIASVVDFMAALDTAVKYPVLCSMCGGLDAVHMAHTIATFQNIPSPVPTSGI